MAKYGTSLTIDGLRPINRIKYFSPGAVGSVGDCIVTPRLKQSAPDLAERYDASFAGQNAVFLGSNVQDGQHIGYDSGGGPSRLLDSNWSGNRSFKTKRGYYMQDVRAPDKFVEPYVSSLGDYSWRNKVATTYEALRTGENFLPLPGPYRLSPGEVPRGGNVPRVTDINYGDLANNKLNSSVAMSANAVTGQEGLRKNPTRAGVSRRGQQVSKSRVR